MKNKGTSGGKSRKEESPAGTAAGTESKGGAAKPAPMTAKEKIAANQKSKRRK